MRLALFQPDIPQNVGAAVRLCACLGAALDIIGPCAFPLSDRAVRRVALDYGALATILTHDSWTAFLAHPARADGRLALMTTRAAQSLYAFDFRAGDTLLMGAESGGASEAAHARAQARLFIPLSAGARSLNVVAAAAIALGEALRQTGAFAAKPSFASPAVSA